jgi:hypothetical protein
MHLRRAGITKLRHSSWGMPFACPSLRFFHFERNKNTPRRGLECYFATGPHAILGAFRLLFSALSSICAFLFG